MCPSIPIIHFLCLVVTLGEHFEWAAVAKYLFFSYILQAILITIVLSVVSQIIGTVLGLLIYFMRRARLGPVRWVANAYTGFFRGTPLIVQILMAFYFFPYLGLSNPLEQINFFPSIGYPQIRLDSFIAALAALSLNEGAYMSEIVRAGIDSIDVGQMEASKSLGMTYFMAMRRIILPQAARVIIPPLGNEFNSMLKNSSLAVVIGLNELLGEARLIAAPQFLNLELYVVAAIWYLAMTAVWTFVQAWIERKLNISVYDVGPTDRGSYWSRLVGFGRRNRVVVSAPGTVVELPADPSRR